MIDLDDDMVLTERDAVLLAGRRDQLGMVELTLRAWGHNPSTGRRGPVYVRCVVAPGAQAAWARAKMVETLRRGLGRIDAHPEIRHEEGADP